MGQLLDEVRGRGLERDLECPGALRAHAQPVHALERALVQRLGVLDRVEKRGVLGRLRRIENAPQGEHEVLRGHRRAVRPGVVAQREGLHRAVVADLPALGGARNHAAVRRLGGQAEEHVADDPVLPDALDVVRVEGIGLAGIRDAQLARGERAAARPEREKRGQARQRPTSACRSLRISLSQVFAVGACGTWRAAPIRARRPLHQLDDDAVRVLEVDRETARSRAGGAARDAALLARAGLEHPLRQRRDVRHDEGDVPRARAGWGDRSRHRLPASGTR